VLGIVGSILLYNQFSTSKQTLASLQSHSEEWISFQDAQSEWEIHKASLEFPDQEVIPKAPRDRWSR